MGRIFNMYIMITPDENIIVMMYDDIANNKENPMKGQVFFKLLIQKE